MQLVLPLSIIGTQRSRAWNCFLQHPGRRWLFEIDAPYAKAVGRGAHQSLAYLRTICLPGLRFPSCGAAATVDH